MADHPTGAARSREGVRDRGGLSPAMTTFVVIDVILVLTFLVLAAMWLGDRPDAPADAAAPTSTAPQEPESQPEESAPADPEQADAVTDFQLPSGNIYCSMTDATAECTIVSFSYAAPDVPEGCSGTVGNVLSIAAGQEATMPCVTTPPAGPSADLPVLEYGEASKVGEMTCQSSPNGVYCQHDPTGKGFSVARAGYRFF